MSDRSKNPILLTGAHRSGKTYFAKAICSTGTVARIPEPLNRRTRPGLGGLRPTYTFHLINHRNGSLFESQLQDSLRYKYHLAKELKACIGFKDYLRIVRDLPISVFHRLTSKRPLIDDPFAVISADWFHTQLGMDVVIMIRHPASFVASIISQRYRFDFNNFLAQNDLMEEHLQGFADEIREFSLCEKPLIEQGILLWRVLYSIVAKYQQNYGSRWLFIRFEDLATHGEPAFLSAFETLGLTLTPAQKNTLARFINAPNHHEAKREGFTDLMGQFARPIEMQVKYFNLKLKEDEISHIRAGTGDVWPLFYSANDW